MSATIQSLEQRLGVTWANIQAAEMATALEQKNIETALLAHSLVPTDCSFVVFGSLARNEVTSGSDVDWTLLVDGQADPHHLTAAHAIKGMLAELDMRSPGATATFGGLTFSHELIHQIGGDSDTNRNTTRRILLLLESRELCSNHVRDRVIRNVYRRYLAADADIGYHAVHAFKRRVPRFLLNDIVRFWRTMAVDYAAKRRERESQGWAIRNVKLRLSRKLIFSAGLALCMSSELRPSQQLLSAQKQDDFDEALLDFVMAFSSKTPLEVLAAFALSFNADEAAAKIFGAYDSFLAILANEEERKRLENMPAHEADGDPLFKKSRGLGNAFQDGLTELYFKSDDQLTAATQRYGVF